MTSAELPLSTRILIVLNPSIISMMTRGLSCGCYTPLVSSSEKITSVASFFLCFVGGIMWTTIDHPYLSHDTLWSFLWFIVVFGLIFYSGLIFLLWLSICILLNKFLQFFFLDQLFYLFFEISAFVHVMPMILMETTILFLISGIG